MGHMEDCGPEPGSCCPVMQALQQFQKAVLVSRRPVLTSLQASMRQLNTKEMLYTKIEAAYRHAMQQPSTLHIMLQPFSVEETRQFISSSLGGVEVRGWKQLFGGLSIRWLLLWHCRGWDWRGCCISKASFREQMRHMAAVGESVSMV
jgi:hypothetical protein